MAKQKFAIAHDVRYNGEHLKAGSPVELDARDGKDAAELHNLLSSNRIVDADIPKAQRALSEADEAPPAPKAAGEPSKAAPAAPE